MYCSYCPEPADFKCACQKPNMCANHLGIHLRDNPRHEYQTFEFELEESRQNQFTSNLKNKIKKINKAKKLINLKTNSLINLIQSMFKQVNTKLDDTIKAYTELLKRNKFYGSDVKRIEKIELFEINVDPLDTDYITSEIKKIYSNDLIGYVENVKNKEIQFLKQHVGGLLCGVLIEEGKTLVTGGYDSTIRGWDLIHEKQKFVLFGHTSYVKCIIVAGDPNFIVSGSWDASVRIWNTQQQTQLAVLKGHKGRIFCICYIENFSLIVSGDENGEAIVWDFMKCEIVHKIVFSASISTILPMKNRSCLIFGVGKTIIFNELHTLTELITMQGHSESINTLALKSDERIMVSGSDDRSIIIWDLVQAIQIFKINGFSGPINCLSLTLDGQFIVSGSDDQTLRVWDMKTCTEILTFTGHTSIICSILRLNQSFLSLSEDSSIGILDTTNGTYSVNCFLEPFKSDFLDFSANSMFLGYGSKNEGGVWDVEKETEVNFLLGHEFDVISVEISRDGLFAISCAVGEEKNLIYWDLRKNQIIAELKGHTSSVFCACFSKYGSSAASGSADKSVRIWNLKERKQEFEFLGHSGYIFSIKFINNKNLLVSAGCDAEVIVWCLSTKTKFAVLSGHKDWIWKLLVTEDEQFIVSCDFLDGIRIWNVEFMRQEIMFRFQEEASSWLSQSRIKLESVKKYLKFS